MTLPKWMKFTVLALVAIAAIALSVIAFRHSGPVRASAASPVPSISEQVPIPVVTFIGDSYTAGTPQDSGRGSEWPALLKLPIAVRKNVDAIGGIGYLNKSAAKGPFSALVPSIPTGSDYVVVYGSRNDDTATKDGLSAAAIDTWAKIRTRAPHATLIIVGPSWVSSTPPAYIVQDRDALRDAAAAQGVSFVDALDWFQGHPEMIGPDGVHPNNAGHAWIAQQMATALTPLITS